MAPSTKILSWLHSPNRKRHFLCTWSDVRFSAVTTQTDSFDSKKLMLLLLSIYPYSPHPLRELEKKPYLHIPVITGLGGLNKFSWGFVADLLFLGVFLVRSV